MVVFLLPTIAALFLGGLRVYEGFEDIGVYDRAEQRIALSQKVAATVDELQSERETMSAWIVSGRPQGRGELDDQIARSDRAATTLRDAPEVEGIDDPVTTALFGQATARLDGLGQLRVSANDASFAALAALESYAGVIDALLAVSDEFGADVTDKGLQDRHDALAALSHAKEFSAQQNAFLRNAAIRGSFEPAELSSINSAEANLVSQIDAFNNVATSQARQDYANTITGELVSRRFQYQQLALLRAEAKINVAIDPGAVAQSSAATLNLISQVENRLLGEAGSYTGDLAGSEQRTLIFVSAGILAGLLVALTLMFVVARSMLVPLRSLRTNALEVAERHLPEAVERIMSESDPKAAAERAIDPVPVHTTEEIGQVARAFDVVNAQAVRLAAEQAMLRENVNGIFVNLSRRSQRLVERQLGVIDRLEADEQDPDHLASLFELDHLATRLRRNGESLLVLSGAGLAKSVPRPVPAADVIGAAVSEIEQYSRVEVGVIPDVAVQGLTIHDLVHVLAELLDNAAYFSEPETKVTVRAVMTRRRALAIQVTDKGVGMSEDQINEANRRLADPPDLDVSVTRRMGLYVVARLAQRHGIEVQLRENEDIDGGIIARVVVPPQLLTSMPVTERPRSESSMPQMAPIGNPQPPSELGVDSLTSPMTLTPLNQQAPPEAPAEISRPQAPVPSADSGPGTGGLVALDQPISLDDLVHGSSSAAGPFLSDAPEPPAKDPVDDQGFPVAEFDENAFPTVTTPTPPPSSNGSNGSAPAGANGHGDEPFPLALPTREPTFVPPVGRPEPDESAESGRSALEDDVPTRRLPIYQSVLSRWFSEAEETEPEETGWPAETPEGTAAAPEGREGAGVTDGGWQSASDEGWQAAQSLLEDKAEGVTEAGLPKRVPNAYLVPGSVTGESTDQSAFTDNSSPQPEAAPSMTRSASVARSRMVSFQRGYQSGRHAVQENPEAGTAVPETFANAVEDGVAGRPTEPSAKE
ncbi:nitrate- and nitrite sensing domain-containing protein [Amycolatopsis sp. YIM 10]|uniref:nitrate- and nitrite sensing domain-containing protein n=1 Tax=Amycolatopsis sp. YIM 10 TaxID=2653857 RepID=UPI001D14F8C5|nr:nitrate- and nitrite sensing domain-containing protein [Amycolatopsis sp. YIM 10]